MFTISLFSSRLSDLADDVVIFAECKTISCEVMDLLQEV